MPNRRSLSDLIDGLIAVAVFGFQKADMEDLAEGGAKSIMKASAIAEAMLVMLCEIETRHLSRDDKHRVAELKKFTISFLRNLHKPGIITRLGKRANSRRVAKDFGDLLQAGGDLCLAICPGRAYQYRLNFGSL